eukprot:759364-Hanusia_phi.AAC.9
MEMAQEQLQSHKNATDLPREYKCIYEKLRLLDSGGVLGLHHNMPSTAYASISSDESLVVKNFAQLQDHVNRRPVVEEQVEGGRPCFGYALEHSANTREWMGKLARDAIDRSSIAAPRASMLLNVRIALQLFELHRAERLNSSTCEQGEGVFAHPLRKRAELPVMVRVGLKTVFLTLQALARERHELLSQVCDSLCEILDGLPPLSLMGEDEEALRPLAETLAEVASGDFSLREREKALRAHFHISTHQGSLSSMLQSALLGMRSKDLQLDVYSLIGRFLQCTSVDGELDSSTTILKRLFQTPLSSLSSASLLRTWRLEVPVSRWCEGEPVRYRYTFVFVLVVNSFPLTALLA